MLKYISLTRTIVAVLVMSVALMSCDKDSDNEIEKEKEKETEKETEKEEEKKIKEMLLETIINNNGTFTMYEYDEQNRITEYISYNNAGYPQNKTTLHYEGAELVKQVYLNLTSQTDYGYLYTFNKIGDTIFIERSETNNEGISRTEDYGKIELNSDGMPVKRFLSIISESLYSTNNGYSIINGNCMSYTYKYIYYSGSEDDNYSIEYTFDNKYSPYYFCKTPKWFMLCYISGNNNNITYADYDDGRWSKFDYIYNDNGYPTIRKETNQNSEAGFTTEYLYK